MRPWIAVATIMVLSSCEDEKPFDVRCDNAGGCIARPIQDPCSTCLSAISAHEAERADKMIEEATCDEIVPCPNQDIAAGSPMRLLCDGSGAPSGGICTFGQVRPE